ncbi:coiled-coil domain-containing protein 57 [Tupaia chinensis]|uniref:coiled-coil domain-containing protein 57 n=1 Tax=Tupaia chinensis TaxID=246437 RepID=UPI000FFBE672|nr:coiled-coil domain-containing protein 57 [Tupaia chinensis]
MAQSCPSATVLLMVPPNPGHVRAVSGGWVHFMAGRQVGLLLHMWAWSARLGFQVLFRADRRTRGSRLDGMGGRARIWSSATASQGAGLRPFLAAGVSQSGAPAPGHISPVLLGLSSGLYRLAGQTGRIVRCLELAQPGLGMLGVSLACAQQAPSSHGCEVRVHARCPVQLAPTWKPPLSLTMGALYPSMELLLATAVPSPHAQQALDELLLHKEDERPTAVPSPHAQQALDELLLHKEDEWRALQAQRSRLQEAALHDSQQQLERAGEELRQLREDFVYNLQLLGERDHELERYDAAATRAGAQEEARQAEVSELRIQVAKLEQALAVAHGQLEELRTLRMCTAGDHPVPLSAVFHPYRDRDREIVRLREQSEHLERSLERRLEELSGELALQRQELLQEFEHEMQKWESESRARADSMSGLVLSHELQVKLLNSELEAIREAGAQAAEGLRRAEAANSALDSELQAQTRALRDLEAAKDARIKEVEGKLHSAALARKVEEEALQRALAELEHLARERDAVLADARAAHAEQLQELQARERGLQARCETLEAQLCRAEQRQAEAAREKDAVIDRLREDASALKASWEAQVARMSQEAVSRDLQAQALQQEAARLRQDVERYRQQLSLRDQAQLALDWQRRCDSIERDHVHKAEALIRGLTTARDQAAARLQEAERTLQEQEALLQAMAQERDEAVRALRVHGPAGREAQGPERQHEEAREALPSTEVQQLREQNAGLRRAIAHMRRQMEALSDQPPAPVQMEALSDQPPDPVHLGVEAPDTGQPGTEMGDTAAPDCVLSLEAEIRNLKHQCEVLEDQLEGVWTPWELASLGSTVRLGALTSETTGGPRPVALGPVLMLLVLQGVAVGVTMPQPLRVRPPVQVTRPVSVAEDRHQPPAGPEPPRSSPAAASCCCGPGPPVTPAPCQVLREPLRLDVVQRELPLEVSQVHLEVLELQRQVLELRRHLGLTQLKLQRRPAGKQSASDTPTLRTEGLTVAGAVGKETQGVPCPHLQLELQPTQALSMSRLQRKLKDATRQILRLRLEREQLVEMGNRLRATLGPPAGRPPLRPLPPGPGAQDPGEPKAPLEQRTLSGPWPPVPVQGPRSAREGRCPHQGAQSQPRSAQGTGGDNAQWGSQAGTAASGQRQHRLITATHRQAPQKENRPPGSPEGSDRHPQGSPSLASSSLQDTWRLLDLGSSPSGLASQDNSATGLPSGSAPPRLFCFCAPPWGPAACVNPGLCSRTPLGPTPLAPSYPRAVPLPGALNRSLGDGAQAFAARSTGVDRTPAFSLLGEEAEGSLRCAPSSAFVLSPSGNPWLPRLPFLGGGASYSERGSLVPAAVLCVQVTGDGAPRPSVHSDVRVSGPTHHLTWSQPLQGRRGSLREGTAEGKPGWPALSGSVGRKPVPAIVFAGTLGHSQERGEAVLQEGEVLAVTHLRHEKGEAVQGGRPRGATAAAGSTARAWWPFSPRAMWAHEAAPQVQRRLQTRKADVVRAQAAGDWTQQKRALGSGEQRLRPCSGGKRLVPVTDVAWRRRWGSGFCLERESSLLLRPPAPLTSVDRTRSASPRNSRVCDGLPRERRQSHVREGASEGGQDPPLFKACAHGEWAISASHQPKRLQQERPPCLQSHRPPQAPPPGGLLSPAGSSRARWQKPRGQGDGVLPAAPPCPTPAQPSGPPAQLHSQSLGELEPGGAWGPLYLVNASKALAVTQNFPEPVLGHGQSRPSCRRRIGPDPELPVPPEGHGPQEAGSPAKPQAPFAIEGMKMAAQPKAKPTRPSRSHPAKPRSCQQPPKIRNYMKD